MPSFNKLIYIMCLSLCLSCSTNTNDSMPSDGLMCMAGEIASEGQFFSECDNLSVIDSLYCPITTLSSTTLSDIAKSYAPLYCRDIGENLRYLSNSGAEYNLVLTNKAFTKSAILQSSAFPCSDDESKRDFYCMKSEEISFDLKTVDNSFVIRINIEAVIDNPAAGITGAGERLTIARSTDPGDPLSFLFPTLRAVVNQRTLHSSSVETGYESISNIILNDKAYFDVISNLSTPFSMDQTKYYYNQEFGLIGFRTPSGELFTLQN